MDLSLEEPSCPVCDDPGRELKQRLGPAWVARCKACGLHYAWPRLGPKAQENLYRENPSPLSPERDAMLGDLMRARVATVLREGKPGKGGLLEIGSGFGHFLDLIRPHVGEVLGSEFSREQARFARQRFGLSIREDDLLAAKDMPRFETIAAFELIEHVPRPGDLLRWAFEHLPPGGQIMLSTPNYRSVFRLLLGPRWFYHIPTQHLTYFTAADFRRVLSALGYGDIRCFTSGRSLLRELGNGHNAWHPHLSLRDQWQENFDVRGRIEAAREQSPPPRRGGLAQKTLDALAWRLWFYLAKAGFGDQLRVYARKPK